MTTRRPTALVTGASRGVGKGIALALAANGYDLVITARTVTEGSGSSPETGGPLEGSLERTQREARELGAECRCVVMDLLDLEALENAAHVALAATDGRLDVLVNNAIYAGPGNDRLFGEVDRRDIINRVTGNLTAQLLFTQTILNAMLRQDEIAGLRGTIVNITSGAGQHTPPAPVGKGGWPLTYAATKAGFHRMADMLALEYGPVGIRACNINPGFIATERVLASETLKFVAEQGAAPSVVGDAVLRFLSDLSLKNGVYLQAQ